MEEGDLVRILEQVVGFAEVGQFAIVIDKITLSSGKNLYECCLFSEQYGEICYAPYYEDELERVE
tara:strand:+ start:7626 stop:7820 length:195 start_codon:yes stop_codon:yes gene_type:complete